MQSEQINELAKALSKAQGEMKSALKENKNSFFKNHTYAGLSNIQDACKEALTRNELCIMQTMGGDKDNMVLITTLAHSSGQWIKSVCPLVVQKPDPQGYGSSFSYFRRYTLAAMLNIAADEDDDAERAMDRISNAQIAELENLLKQTGESFQKEIMSKLAMAGVKTFRELTKPFYERVLQLTHEQIKVMEQRGAPQK